jgi:pimeloyl-ACP methyl ester carboxylesterase
MPVTTLENRWQSRARRLGGILLLAAGMAGTAAAGDFILSPPGQLVDIGRFSLHIHCEGEGTPTVVVDTGLGASALEWLPVQERLRHYTRTCLYDRAGYGWSDFGELPRSSSRSVNELYLLLKNARIPGPYVLVGHSYGGMNMQLFARRYPYLVSGLVLVDSSSPGQVDRVQTRFLEYLDSVKPVWENGVRTTDFVAAPQIPETLPDDGPALQALMMMSRDHTRRVVANEFINFKTSARQVARNASRLPDVPTVVLSRGVRQGLHDNAWEPASEDAWETLQATLAYSLPRAAHIVAERSGHQIHIDQPELVVDATAMVIDFVRADSRRPRAHDPVALSWLPFTGGRWKLDRLHTMTDLCPFGCDDRRALAMFRHAGHLAGTHTPAWQRVPLKERLYAETGNTQASIYSSMGSVTVLSTVTIPAYQ